MQPLHLVLACAGGMSSSLLVAAVQKAAAKINLTVTVEAIPSAFIEKRLTEIPVDVVLLAPQVRYELPTLQKKLAATATPIAIMEMRAYGTVDGDKILQQALSVSQKK